MYGILNSRGNRLAFSDDSAYYLLCALEILDDDGNFQGKADMFSKRTIQPHKVVTSVDTAVEALTISIGERACVDLGYMSSLSGKPTDALATDLKGIIFHDPKLGTLEDLTGWVTADEYLSGNVRQKLKDAETAAAENPMYRSNVDALRAAQPKDLEASEIEVRLGATWIDKAYIQQFMYELENFGKKYVLTMQGKLRHPAELGSDTRGNLIRLDNALSQMPLRLQALQTHLEETYHQQAAAKAEVGKPWPYEQELQNKTARLIFLDAELNLDAGGQSEPVIAKSSRPSILSRLKSAPPQSKNPKPKKHHEEVR